MDASSFKKEDQRASETHVNFLFFTYHALAGGIAYNPAQKWYYYSHQKTTEVLVFHQYSKVKNKILNEILIKIFFFDFRENGGQILIHPFRIKIVPLERKQEFLLNSELHYSFEQNKFLSVQCCANIWNSKTKSCNLRLNYCHILFLILKYRVLENE